MRQSEASVFFSGINSFISVLILSAATKLRPLRSEAALQKGTASTRSTKDCIVIHGTAHGQA